MGALVAVASMAVGAGSVIFVQSGNAYSAVNPNAAAENSRITRQYTRSDVRRRDAGVVETTSYVNDAEPLHAAATSRHEYTVDELTERCLDMELSRIRLSHCLVNARNGLKYQTTQFKR